MAKLERWQDVQDDGIFPNPTGEWTNYNDAAALIAKLREALRAVLDMSEGWRDGWRAAVGESIENGREAIAEAEGIEPDKEER